MPEGEKKIQSERERERETCQACGEALCINIHTYASKTMLISRILNKLWRLQGKCTYIDCGVRSLTPDLPAGKLCGQTFADLWRIYGLNVHTCSVNSCQDAARKKNAININWPHALKKCRSINIKEFKQNLCTAAKEMGALSGAANSELTAVCL